MSADRYVGVVMTVRNEHDLLRANLLFHRHVGICRFYIYADSITDTTLSTVWDVPEVVPLRSSLHRWLTSAEISDAERLSSRFLTHHTARQIINCHDAVRRAREEGLSWLVSLDPDELLVLHDHQVRRNCVADFLMGLERQTETVTFLTNEVLPTLVSHKNVFAEEIFFKSRYGFGEGLRSDDMLRPVHAEYRPIRLSGDEYARKRNVTCEKNHFWAQYEHVLDVPQIVVNKARSFYHRSDWFIGHVIGKQAFRIDREIHFQSLHTVRASNDESNQFAGRLLHYNCYSLPKFFSKYTSFRTHPTSYAKGAPVDPLKLILRDLVNEAHSPGEDTLKALFFNEIFANANKRDSIREHWPESILSVHSVSEAFQTHIQPPG